MKPKLSEALVNKNYKTKAAIIYARLNSRKLSAH